MTQIDIAILGAAGMGGGELMRYLLQHPAARLQQLVSRSHAGQSVTAAHPHLAQLAGKYFSAELVSSDPGSNCPLVLFCAMSHGELAQRYEELDLEIRALFPDRQIVVIDLSADFRLSDTVAWQKYYGTAHPCPDRLADFVYGIPELNRGQIAGADRIASPGCFATAINLSLLPLAGRLAGRHIAISAMTGSSGSGVKPTAGTHHPHRAHDLRAYNMLAHRHQAEAEMLLGQTGNAGARISFVPHSAPLVRGIFATTMVEFDSPTEAEAAGNMFAEFYATEPFIDLLDYSPRVATVAGSNQAQIHATAKGRSLVVLCAIDNLGKGMAGQAIQNMNIALGLAEVCGLQQAAVYP